SAGSTPQPQGPTIRPRSNTIEVSRLFASISSRRHQRHSNATISLLTYTHIFCCLGRKDSTFVPRQPYKDHLHRAGLGQWRICFQ
ncbi:hypothetical protein AMECASPLE_037286, partial [Ameca splendens]